jgi:hypothetical protein
MPERRREMTECRDRRLGASPGAGSREQLGPSRVAELRAGRAYGGVSRSFRITFNGLRVSRLRHFRRK